MTEEKDEIMLLAKRLMRAIKRPGETDAQCAARVGVTTRTITNWKNGKGLGYLLRLEKAGAITINPAPPPKDAEQTDLSA